MRVMYYQHGENSPAYWEVQFALWQERTLTDPIESMEDSFILDSLTWSDFIE